MHRYRLVVINLKFGRRKLNCLPNICDLSVDEIKYVGLHNAMATTEDGFFLGPNHEFPLEQALEAGFRAVNLDVGSCGGRLELVHGHCRLGKKDPETTFANINNFLERNPRDLVVITLQLDENAGGEAPDMTELYNIMGNVPNFTKRIYEHKLFGGPWPKIGDLLNKQKQVIIFHYGGPLCYLNEYDCPPGFHDMFYFGAETQFKFNSVARLENRTYSCEITRGANSRRRFFGLNNFITLPSFEAADIVNQEAFVSQHVQACETMNDLDVNFVYVDFWTRGNLPQYVQNANRVLGDAPKKDSNGGRRSLFTRIQGYWSYFTN